MIVSCSSFAADDAHGDAYHKEIEGLPQLDITTFASQIFWLLIIFVTMYLIFSKRALPDISSTIENRKNHIDSDLKSAEDLHAKADTVQSDYEDSLQSARDNAAKEVHDIEASMKDKLNSQLADFQKRSEEQMEQAENNIQNAKTMALGGINDVAAEIAAHSVTKIIGVETNKDQALSVIENMNGKAKAA